MRQDDLHRGAFYVPDSDDINDYKRRARSAHKRKEVESFGSQEIDIYKYVLAPESWQGFVLGLYIIFIPYINGIMFLYFFIAGAVFEKFSLLELSSFFIIWAIGYEVTAALLLTYIFISYLRYLARGSKLAKE